MLIPYRQLSEDALAGILDEYILREGTDYGTRELGMEEKRARLRKQLERGDVVITFDARSRSCSIVPRTDMKPGAPNDA